MDDAVQLLQDILKALNAIPNQLVPRKYADSIRFEGTYDIARAIGEFLNKNKPGLNSATEQFDPYSDPETRKMLERAGIATHRFRK